MKIHSVNEIQKIRNRLNRLEGQLRGINQMLVEGRECGEVLEQLSAARSALQATITAYMQVMVNDCLLTEGDDAQQRKQLASEMLTLIHKV